MRLFTGLDLPPDLVNSLDGLMEKLRPVARLKWSPSANLHITTRFIGEWPEDRLPELRMALGRIPGRPAIRIRVSRLGFFPSAITPLVFWAGIDTAPELVALAADTDRALEPLGLVPEGRPFRPHLTLARIKGPVALGQLRESVAALPSLEFGSFEADRFFLYRSRPGSSGSEYNKLAEFSILGRGSTQ